MYNSYKQVNQKIGNYFAHGSESEGNRRLTYEAQGEMSFDFVKQTSEDAWVCEIGSLYGHMTIVMAMACLGSNRRVVSVDHMVGNHCMHMSKRPKCIYLELIDNLLHFEVLDKVVLLPMKSFGYTDISELKKDLIPVEILKKDYLQAFEMIVAMGIEFEYIYVDGNHTYENVLRELELYTTLLKSGGVIAGDDCNYFANPFRESFLKDAPNEGHSVVKAVNGFFRGNNDFEPLDVPINQFAFRKK